jgi:hypothetical protein
LRRRLTPAMLARLISRATSLRPTCTPWASASSASRRPVGAVRALPDADDELAELCVVALAGRDGSAKTAPRSDCPCMAHNVIPPPSSSVSRLSPWTGWDLRRVATARLQDVAQDRRACSTGTGREAAP